VTDTRQEPDTTQTGTDSDCPAEVVEAAVGELAWADPRTLIVGANVRGEVRLDAHFVRDIADRGVREPIPVRRRDEDGALVVRKGKRRTLAAIEAGLGLVRVFIEPEPDPGDVDTAGQIDRIVDQLGENHHRATTTDADEVRAHQELLDLGLSAGQIARRTHTSTKRVRVTTRVARSGLAVAVLSRYDLTLDQVAVIAEFDDTTPDGVASAEGVDAVKLLTVTAQREPAQFAHVAQRLRDDREDRQLHAARVAELTAAGIRVLDPGSSDTDSTNPGTDTDTGNPDGGAVRLSSLRPAPFDLAGTVLTEDAHAGCPGHAATVAVERGWRAGPSVTTTWWCTDPDGNGHAPRWDRPATGGGVGSGAREPGPMSEQEKAQRRRVVANNKDWDSATTVRKQWLQGFLTRKNPPKDAARYIAATLATGGHDVRKAMENAHPTACELLGLPAPEGFYLGTPNPITAAVETAGTARLTMLTLAVLLGAAEDGTSRNSWRNPSSGTRAYFAALAEWNYPLSPVEQLVGNPDGPDDADADAVGEDPSDAGGPGAGDEEPDGDRVREPGVASEDVATDAA
jgi:ParB family chromosome partitioning protein